MYEYRIVEETVVNTEKLYYAEHRQYVIVFKIKIPTQYWRSIKRRPYSHNGYTYDTCTKAQAVIDEHKSDIIKAYNKSKAKFTVINDNECNESI